MYKYLALQVLAWLALASYPVAVVVAGEPDGTTGTDVQSDTALVRTFAAHTGTVSSVSVSGTRLYTGSLDTTVKRWDTETGDLLATYEGHLGAVTAVFATADDETVFSGSADRTVRQWRVADGAVVREFRVDQDSQTATVAAIHVHDGWLYTAGADKVVQRFQVATGQRVQVYEGAEGALTDVHVSADGAHVFAASFDRTVRMWDAQSGNLIQTYSGHLAPVTAVVAADAGDFIYTTGYDATLKQWLRETGECVQTLDGGGWLRALAVSGGSVYVGTQSGSVQRWQPQNSADADTDIGSWVEHPLGISREYADHFAQVTAVVVSGPYVYSGSADRTVKQWRADAP